MANGKTSAKDDNQVQRFKETARALGCDEDEAAFDEKLRVIARHRTPEMVRAELAEANAELKRLRDAFDRYTGNNPKKYAAETRRAAARVERLDAELKRLG